MFRGKRPDSGEWNWGNANFRLDRWVNEVAGLGPGAIADIGISRCLHLEYRQVLQLVTSYEWGKPVEWLRRYPRRTAVKAGKRFNGSLSGRIEDL